ncbi:unnamed protein product [Withania somnifera]
MDILYTIFTYTVILLCICVTPISSIRNPKSAPLVGTRETYTTYSRNIEHILNANFGKYSKGKKNHEVIMDLFGEGIFAMDAEKWKQQRKLASFEFSERVLRDFSYTELLMRCSLDSIFKVSFGVDLNCLDGSGGDNYKFIKAFDDSNALTYWNIKFIHIFVNEFIKTSHKQLEMKQDSIDKEDILSRFLVESKQDPEKMTDQHLRDIILHLCVLAKTDKDILEDFVTSITEEVLEKMHYLHAALTETLRLYPAVPVEGSWVDTDDVLPYGFHIRKGDEVNYISYAMARMPYIWGNDAEDFRPERWDFPARAGPRICVGKDFAYKQMKILAMALLHFFRFKLSDEMKLVTYRIMFTLHINEGLPVHAVPR